MSKDSSSVVSTPAKRKLTGWQIALVALIATVFIYFVAQFLSEIIASTYPLLRHWSTAQAYSWLSNSVGGGFVYGVLAEGLMVVGVAFMLKLLHWQWKTIGLTIPKLEYFIYGIIAVVPYYFLYFVAIAVVGALVKGFNARQQQDIGFTSVHGSLPLLMTFIALVVVPPLAEEIVMRGFLYTSLKKWAPPVVSGLLVSALFGAAHLAEGGPAGPLWVGAIETFTLSLTSVFLREKTGSLWAGITLHAANNSVAFIALFITGGR